MKQIVDGLLYDTDNATLIYKEVMPRKPRDYYQTEKGTFFCHYKLVGEIRVISEDTMKDILAERDVEAYIRLFGKVEEG